MAPRVGMQESDLHAVMKAGIDEPPETSLRLEHLARTIADWIDRSPENVAAAFVSMERDRMSKYRQLTYALMTLGQRNAQLEATEAALQEAAEMIRQLQQSPFTRLWHWWQRS